MPGAAGTQPRLSVSTPPPAKPLLRGWSHAVGFVVMVTLGVIVIALAEGAATRTLLVVYVAGLGTMLGVSALYHRRRWGRRGMAVMSRLDHSAIYVAIAATYTPVAAICLSGWARPAVLAAVWTAATAGIVLQWLPVRPHRALLAGLYVGAGWVALVALPQLFHGMGAVGFSLVLAGGIVYTVGALVFATRRPDPWPRVFGFHEVFHALTLVAAGLQLAAIAFTVVPQGS
jgi:hemolysin III